MSPSPERTKIIGASAARAALKRMAYEIYESNFSATELAVIGIGKRGSYIARLLIDFLHEISPLKTSLTIAQKKNKGLMIEQEGFQSLMKDASVVIVDDVLYSGRTLFLAIAAAMEHQPAKVQTAVLIDRGHRNFPVTHDFVGMSLATTLQQHVSVTVADEQRSVIAYVE